jgi:hypothetical protein
MRSHRSDSLRERLIPLIGQRSGQRVFSEICVYCGNLLGGERLTTLIRGQKVLCCMRPGCIDDLIVDVRGGSDAALG